MPRVIAINAETFAPSEYALPWSDVVSHNGTIYGVAEDGIYTLSGDIEPEATPYVKTGNMVLAPGYIATPHPVRMLLSSEAPLSLEVTGDTAGKATTYPYTVVSYDDTERRDRLVPLGRGVKADAWTFKLGSTSGNAAPWSISSLSVNIPAIKQPLN